MGLALTWVAGHVGMRAQQALNDRDAHVFEHKLGPDTAIHLSAEEYRDLSLGREYMEMEITVSPNGRVDNARIIGDSWGHGDEAVSIEMQRMFRPWTIDGAATRVRVNDYVSLLPPEEWAEAHTPFPNPWTLQGASVRLTRTTCYGTCPDYEVTIAGDGTIQFRGLSFVLIPGDHLAHTSPQAVKDLIQEFEKANFFSAKDAYSANWTDNPTQTLTLTVAGRTKTVRDYVGTAAGMPLSIRNLEQAVDEVAGTARWVKGDASTLKALEDEHWPFAAATRPNVGLYDAAISNNNSALVARFLAAGGPIASPNAEDDSPICVASRAGNLELVQRMMTATESPKRPPHKNPTLLPGVMNQCLLAAARGGDLEVLEYWLNKGADPTVQPVKTSEGTSSWSVLANGILSGNAAVVQRLLDYKVDVHTPILAGDPQPVLIFALERGDKETPAIVELLIRAGADVNARGQMGETPIFAAHSAPEAVKLLLAAGADLGARNDNGSTALIRYGFVAPMVQALLAAGADPTLVDKKGDDALQVSRQYDCPACTAMIEEALKKKIH